MKRPKTREIRSGRNERQDASGKRTTKEGIQEKNKEVYKFGQGVKQNLLKSWLPFLITV